MFYVNATFMCDKVSSIDTLVGYHQRCNFWFRKYFKLNIVLMMPAGSMLCVLLTTHTAGETQVHTQPFDIVPKISKASSMLFVASRLVSTWPREGRCVLEWSDCDM